MNFHLSHHNYSSITIESREISPLWDVSSPEINHDFHVWSFCLLWGVMSTLCQKQMNTCVSNSVRISRITIGSWVLAFQVTAICRIIPAVLVPLIAHVTTCTATVSVCMSTCICSYRLHAHWRVCAEFKSFGKWIERAYIDEDSVRSVSGGRHCWPPGLRRTLQNPAQTSWLESKGRKWWVQLEVQTANRRRGRQCSRLPQQQGVELSWNPRDNWGGLCLWSMAHSTTDVRVVWTVLLPC